MYDGLLDAIEFFIVLEGDVEIHDGQSEGRVLQVHGQLERGTDTLNLVKKTLQK